MSHISTKEFDRLVKYSEGLGIQVIYKYDDNSSYAAQFIFSDPPTIELVISHKNNKTDMILALLHELGHFHDWLNSGKREPSTVFAKEHADLNAAEREVVYRSEVKATILAVKTAEHVELKYPKMWRVKLESAYDRWQYKYFMNNGKFPSRKERREKNRQLRLSYKV